MDALDSGIRHLDVAPIYGMGQAEIEVGKVMQRQRDSITVTTKFGIELTTAGRMFGHLQRPVRAVLRKMPSLNGGVKKSAQSPSAGRMGELLYDTPALTRVAAAQSLERSLRALNTDYVDVFALHAPSAEALVNADDVLDYLDQQINRGHIRSWGIAGDIVLKSEIPESVVERTMVIQSRLEYLDPFRDPADGSGKGCIAFGIFDGVLPAVQDALEQHPEKRRYWSDRLDIDLADASIVPQMLLRNALFRNKCGPVLYSSTNSDRVRAAALEGSLNIDPLRASEENLALTDLCPKYYSKSTESA